MVKVTYYRDKHRVTISGHANSAEIGKDLVCAGVSTLALTLATFIANAKKARQVNGDVVKMNEGDTFISCDTTSKYRGGVTLAFDTVCAGFEALAQTHPEHVSYEIV